MNLENSHPHVALSADAWLTAQSELVQPPSVIVPTLEREPEIVRLGHLLQRQPVPWIGWNTTDEPALTLAAFTAERVRYFPLP